MKFNYRSYVAFMDQSYFFLELATKRSTDQARLAYCTDYRTLKMFNDLFPSTGGIMSELLYSHCVVDFCLLD